MGLNTLVLTSIRNSKVQAFILKEYKPQSLSGMWRRARVNADMFLGAGNWTMKRDASLAGGYIVATNGDCILIK
jgi:hypothetical protein